MDVRQLLEEDQSDQCTELDVSLLAATNKNNLLQDRRTRQQDEQSAPRQESHSSSLQVVDVYVHIFTHNRSI